MPPFSRLMSRRRNIAQTGGLTMAPAVLTITFVGNMAVHLSDGQAAILTDFPYESGYSGYMQWQKAQVPGGPRPLCVITHSHRDHFRRDLAGEYCGALLGPADATKGFGGDVLPISDAVASRGATIRPIRTDHAGLEHYSYRLSWHGRDFYFTGDTDDTSALLAQKDLDVAFVSPWLLDAVRKAGKRVDAKRVVVYHHEAGTKDSPYPGARVPAQGEKWSLP
jgi:L-ascorbate metabolism protein UlaG (beta-lactamase superfamily)